MVRARVKPYLAKTSTPDFFENMMEFLSGVVKGIPQNELQGETKELDVKDIIKFSEETAPKMKEGFAEWLLNKTEQEVGKKYPPGKLKGREKILDDLENGADIKYIETMRNVEETIEEAPEGYRDEIMRGGEYQSESVSKLDRGVDNAYRDLKGLISSMEGIKEPGTQKIMIRRERFRESGIPEEIMEKYRVIDSMDQVEDFKEVVRND